MDQYKAERLVKAMEECLRDETHETGNKAVAITQVLTAEQQETFEKFMGVFDRSVPKRKTTRKTAK